NPAMLRVSFFGPFYSDYRVLYIDPNYQYVLVGSKSPKYLWILSRKPQMDVTSKYLLVNEAAMRGYDVDKLIWVKQYR
ncbi:MAG: lipocalin family protein, partial [Bacteroidales bacterium]|nr:lipocalin family protein [Bacteroidales bacterium]